MSAQVQSGLGRADLDRIIRRGQSAEVVLAVQDSSQSDDRGVARGRNGSAAQKASHLADRRNRAGATARWNVNLWTTNPPVDKRWTPSPCVPIVAAMTTTRAVRAGSSSDVGHPGG